MTHRDTKRIVIADAGPLIALVRIEALYLLHDLFGRVWITTTVRDELLPAESTFADSDLLASVRRRLDRCGRRWRQPHWPEP